MQKVSTQIRKMISQKQGYRIKNLKEMKAEYLHLTVFYSN